jgi:hypothetical protein
VDIGSGFEKMGRGPVLALGRIVPRGPFLFFLFIFSFLFLFFLCTFAKQFQTDFKQLLTFAIYSPLFV